MLEQLAIDRLSQKLKKAKQIITSNCIHKIRDGHMLVCDYPDSPVTHCNKEGRKKCPLLLLLED